MYNTRECIKIWRIWWTIYLVSVGENGGAFCMRVGIDFPSLFSSRFKFNFVANVQKWAAAYIASCLLGISLALLLFFFLILRNNFDELRFNVYIWFSTKFANKVVANVFFKICVLSRRVHFCSTAKLKKTFTTR